MSSKAQKVIDYYLLCHTLKDTIRTGWQVWNVKRDRLESIAEHIYGVQMLAIAMKSEYQYDIDLTKVIFMLAIHELGETVIGDDCVIGGKAFVTSSVPPHTRVSMKSPELTFREMNRTVWEKA